MINLARRAIECRPLAGDQDRDRARRATCGNVQGSGLRGASPILHDRSPRRAAGLHIQVRVFGTIGGQIVANGLRERSGCAMKPLAGFGAFLRPGPPGQTLQMALADQDGLVARVPQQIDKGDIAPVQRDPVSAHIMARGHPTGHLACDVKSVPLGPLHSDGIDMRGLAHGMPHAALVVCRVLVRDEQDEIRSLGRRRIFCCDGREVRPSREARRSRPPRTWSSAQQPEAAAMRSLKPQACGGRTRPAPRITGRAPAPAARATGPWRPRERCRHSQASSRRNWCPADRGWRR